MSVVVNGIVGIFMFRGVNFVFIEEMVFLFKMKKKDVNFILGMWVRMKRGKYVGDLV